MKLASNRLAYRRIFNELILAVDREYNHAYLNLYNWKTGFITWTDDENKLRWVQLRRYDKCFLRLAAKGNSLPPPHINSCWLTPNCEFELTFAPQESRALADGLVRFVNSSFEHPDDENKVWKWPLFAHDENFPNYAWSKLANDLYANKDDE